MKNSVEMMRKVFTKLGYAVLVLATSPTHGEVVDGIKAIASQPIPKSYKRFFFYTCAHGFDNGIHAYYDDVQLDEIVTPLCKSEHLQSIPIVFFFDSCRTQPSSPHSADLVRPDIIDRQNVMIVRATFRNCPTLADDGCGLFTYALARVLPQVRDTLVNVVNKDIPEEMKRTVTEHPDNVMLTDAFNERVPVVAVFAQIERISLVEEMEQMGKSIDVGRVCRLGRWGEGCYNCITSNCLPDKQLRRHLSICLYRVTVRLCVCHLALISPQLKSLVLPTCAL